jgi:FkbM family methyltransferase
MSDNNINYLNNFPSKCKGLKEPSPEYMGQWCASDGYQSYILSRKFIETISEYSEINFNEIKTIFDIGSRDCLQSVELSTWFPESKIFAFEANPKCINLCEKTLRHYSNNTNINLIPNAVCDYDGTTIFHHVDNGNIGAGSILKNSGHKRSNNWHQTEITVPCTRIDTFCNKNQIEQIDLVWMDVQGFEREVLQSFGPLLNTVKAIHTEVGIETLYKNQILKDELDEYLQSYGFSLVNETRESMGTESDCIYVRSK